MRKRSVPLEDDETEAPWQDEDETGGDDESASDGDDDESERESAPDGDEDPESPSPKPAPVIITERQKNRPRGPNGMGRPTTGPPIRAGASRVTQPEIIDASDWPGTAMAAKIVGRHPSTIKAWRTQGRLRAVQAEDGTYRYHPEDLAELESASDGSDPASVLAAGMTAIVTQGATASDRVLAMTELATKGLERTIELMSGELSRAYARITQLETERVALLDRVTSGRAEEMRHERRMRILDQRHALDLEGAKETSQRVAGLIELLGPIARSIIEQMIPGAAPAAPAASAARLPSPSASADSAVNPSVTPSPFETRVAEAMTRLCTALRAAPAGDLERLAVVAGEETARDLRAAATGADPKEVGRALGALTATLRRLDPAVFRALVSLCPPELAAVATELRTLLTVPQTPPE